MGLTSLEILPFTDERLDEAAALLASRHRADRQRETDLPARFEDPAAARDVLQTITRGQDTHGVLALRGGRAVGYLRGHSERRRTSPIGR